MTGRLLEFRPRVHRGPRRGICPDCDGNGEHLAWSLQAGLRIVGCLACRNTGRYAPAETADAWAGGSPAASLDRS